MKKTNIKLLLLLGIFFTVVGCDGCGKDKQKEKIEVIFKELAEKEKPVWDKIAAKNSSAASKSKASLQVLDEEFKKIDSKKDRKDTIIKLQTVAQVLISSLRAELLLLPLATPQSVDEDIAPFQELIDLKLRYYKQAAEVE